MEQSKARDAAYVGGLTRLTFGNSSHWKRVLPTQVAA